MQFEEYELSSLLLDGGGGGGVAYCCKRSGTTYFSKSRSLNDRVARLRAQWLTCNTCGDKNRELRFYSRSIRTTPRMTIRDGLFCSSECSQAFHASADERLRAKRPWPHASRCLLADMVSPQIQHEGASKRTSFICADDIDRHSYIRLFRTVESIHRTIDQYSSELKGSVGDAFRKWAAEFENWTQSLDPEIRTGFLHDLQTQRTALQLVLKSTFPEHYNQFDRLFAQLVSIFPAQEPATTTTKGGGRCLLALDGGGMRAVVSLTILRHLMGELVKQTGRKQVKLSEFFDLVIGTSTGGVMTAGLMLMDKSVDELFAMYERLGTVIFSEENKFHGQNPLAGLIVKYNDYPLTMLLMAESKLHRMDEAPLLYTLESGRVRVALTAVDITTTDAKVTLFRNYDLPGAEQETRFPGTNHLFLWEGIRSTTSAPTYFHPYDRSKAPLEGLGTGTNIPFVSRGQSRYLQTQSSRLHEAKLITHIDLMVKQQPGLASKIKSDTFMNGKIFVDGGMGANNPSLVAVVESHRIWPDERIAFVLSVGTGHGHPVAHASWNGEVTKPLESALLFRKPNMIQVLQDLLTVAIAAPAAESEDTVYIMETLTKEVDAYARLNATLSKDYPLDAAKPEMLEDMKRATEEWCSSPAGNALISQCARDLILIKG